MSKEGRGELVGNSKILRQASHVAKRLGVLGTSRASCETMQARHAWKKGGWRMKNLLQIKLKIISGGLDFRQIFKKHWIEAEDWP